MMRCVCGVKFDSHKPDESYDHRQHIYAVHLKDARRDVIAGGQT
jgi:hypothetical protein